MSGAERALNFAIRVRGSADAAQAFKEISASAKQTARDMTPAAAAGAAYEAAVDRASAAAAAFGAAQQLARRETDGLKSQLKAGAIGAAEYQARISEIKSGVAVFRAEQQATARAVAATTRELVDQQQATLGVASAQRQFTTATNRMTGSTRAGFQQLGFQFNDITTQLGTMPASMRSYAQIFSQQSGQVIQSIAMMSGESGKFARFMTGPWGLAITSGVSLLALLASSYFSAEDAASDSASATARLKDKLDLSKNSYESLIAVVNEYNAAQEKSEGVTLAAAEAAKKKAAALLQEAKAHLEALKVDPQFIDGDVGAAMAGREAAISGAEARIRHLEQDIRNSERVIADLGVKARLSAEEAAKQAAGRELAILEAKQEKGLISAKRYADERFEIEQNLEKRLDELRREKREERRGNSTETSSFIMPVSGGRATGQFGEKRPDHMHAGIDIAVPVGTAVRAPAGGTVIEAGQMPGYGNVIFIDHGGGTITRLAHLSRIGVQKGASVDQGDVIGASGGARGAPGAGNSQGPHLHYEVRVGGRAVDPRKGAFRTDAMGAAARAGDAAERAQREAERAQREADRRAEQDVRDRESAIQMIAGLDRQLLDAKKSTVTDYHQLAALARQEVVAEGKNLDAAITKQAAGNPYIAAQQALLHEKVAQLVAEKQATIDTDEKVRQLGQALDDQMAANDNRRDFLEAQGAIADTANDRRRIALELLKLDQDEAQQKQENIIAQGELGKYTKAEVDRARDRLALLQQIAPLQNEVVRRQNLSPIEQYLQDTDPNKTGERVEKLVVGQLEDVRDGINDAISGMLGVENPLLKGLLEIFLDEVLFRPIAQALQSTSGSGDGGLLSTLFGFGSAIIGSAGGGLDLGKLSVGTNAAIDAGIANFKLPGYASGTPSAPIGRNFWVGENGREMMRYHGGGRLEVISGPAAHREAPSSGGDTFVSNYIVPARADSRATRSAVARGQQMAIARAQRKGLAK